MTYTRGSRYSF